MGQGQENHADREKSIRVPGTVTGGVGVQDAKLEYIIGKHNEEGCNMKNEGVELACMDRTYNEIGCDEASPHTTKDEGEEHIRKIPALLAPFEEKYTRSYNAMYDIIFRIINPLLVLICVAMLCGHFVARAESSAENLSNKAAIDSIIHDYMAHDTIVPSLKSTYNNCLDKYLLLDDSGNNLKEFIASCTSGAIVNITSKVKILRDKHIGQSYRSDVTQNWIKCTDSNDGIVGDGIILENLVSSFETISEIYIKDDLVDEMKSNEVAISEAMGYTECAVHSAGGTVFWFTVMTTIGYGNAVPITATGRMIVVLFGFLSILGFTACISQSSAVMLKIIDGIFDDHKMLAPLAKDSFTSACMWLVMFLLWVLVLAATAVQYAKDIGIDFPYQSSLWLAFVSVTTIGFGDFSIPHNSFSQKDMFYIPLTILIGFILLGNFLYKLTGCWKLFKGRLKVRKSKKSEK